MIHKCLVATKHLNAHTVVPSADLKPNEFTACVSLRVGITRRVHRSIPINLACVLLSYWRAREEQLSGCVTNQDSSCLFTATSWTSASDFLRPQHGSLSPPNLVSEATFLPQRSSFIVLRYTARMCRTEIKTELEFQPTGIAPKLGAPNSKSHILAANIS